VKRQLKRSGAQRFSAAILAMTFAGAMVASGVAARAEDTQTFSIEMHDGKITPLRLEVPANKRFRIELHNTGKTAAEFESSELHLEKVLAPNDPKPTPVLVIRSLDPGEHVFFDDLHADAPKIILFAK
jgi:hypothetical protein